MDYDGDGNMDLVVVGEWMPVTVFHNRGDGDEDLILGNLGLNARITAGPDTPARLYLHDFDGNGSLDPILATYRNGVSYPAASAEMLRKEIEPLRKQYPTYADFGARRVQDLFPDEQLAEATVKKPTSSPPRTPRTTARASSRCAPCRCARRSRRCTHCWSATSTGTGTTMWCWAAISMA